LPNSEIWLRKIAEIECTDTPVEEVMNKVQIIVNNGQREKIIIRVADGVGLRESSITCDLKDIPLKSFLELTMKSFNCELRYQNNVVELFISGRDRTD